MTSRRNIFSLALSAGAALMVTEQVAAKAMTVRDDVRVAIEAVVAGETAAWNRGDAAAFVPASDDIAFTNIIGVFTVGRAPFEAQHKRIFAGIYKGSTMTQRVEHIALVRPDVAIVETVIGVSDAAALPPGVEAADGILRTRLEQVMVRDGGRWTVAAFHNVVINARALAQMGQ